MPHLLVHQKTVYAEVLLHKDDFLNGNGMMPARICLAGIQNGRSVSH